MNKKNKRIIVIAVAAVLLIAAVVTIILVASTNSAGYRSISIAEIFGKVITQNSGKTYEAYKNMRLADGYALTTDPDSYTRMVLDDDKYVKLEQESHAVFEALGDAKKHLTTIRLEKGALTTEITKPLTETESYVVNTPNAVLAVRGTFFRVEVKQETNGDYYCDVYTYGGMVDSHRIMPDGTHVDEEIVIPAGYKATIKMDEIITVYLEEKIEEKTDNIDPLHISEVNDDDLVSMYNASRHGHEMFLPTEELWNEISDRDIDLSEYKSVYDGADILPFTSDDIGNSDSFPDNSAGNSESSADSSDISDSSDQSSDSSNETSNNSTSEPPNEASSAPSGSDDDNSHDAGPAPLPPQSSSVSSPVSEPTPVESTSSTSIDSVPMPGTSDVTSSSSSSGFPVESVPTTSTNSGNSDSSSDNTSPDTQPSPPVHTHTPEETRIEPTCVSNGRLTRKCSECGELLEETVIPAKGHTEISETTPSTCTEGGKAVYFCSICEIILRTVDIPAAGHTIETFTVSATCTEAGKVTERCSVCNDTNETIIPATGHSFGEYISNNNATCLKDGTKSAICGVCGERKTIPDEGSMLPHTPNTITVPSTCTMHGSETVICRVCEFIITPKRGLPFAEHTEVTDTVDPTCTDDGKTTVTCSVCGEIIDETVIDALGHDEITETEGNIETVKCSVCGEIIKQTNTATGVVYPVEVNAENFPDEAFRQYVLDNFDTDGDGKLSLEESNAVKSIDVSGRDVDSLKGMDIFAELEEVKYTIHVEDGELDISGIGNIDVSNVSNVRGGETSGGTDIISGITKGSEIGFDYNPGTGKTVTFTLVPDESSTFAPETPEGVTINAENFPDEVFREYISTNFDKDDNGHLSQEECEAVTEIDVSGTSSNDGGITSLKGIEKFTNLQKLQCMYNSELTELDVRQNMALEYLWFNYTSVASIDARNNKALTQLGCMNSSISSLDLSQNIMLKQLRCGYTSIKSLNLINNSDLSELRCPNNQLAFIDVSGNLNLSKLVANDNKHPIHVENGVFDLKSIVDFDTSKIVDGTLTGATIDENGVLSGITEGTNITYTYDCDGKGGHDETFTLVPDESSTFADATPDGVAINAENFPDEKFREYISTNFDTDSNGYLSQEECEAVTTIDIKGTYLTDGGYTSLKGIEYFVKLESLKCCYNSGITKLDVSKNTALKVLWCRSTSIASLNMDNNAALTELQCNDTQITSLNVSFNTALMRLDCYNTKITSLNVSKNTALETLFCENTQITSLDLSNNTALASLNCESTAITSLDVRNNTVLNWLNCSHTQIPFIDISNNTTLYADYNNHFITVVKGEFDTKTIPGFNPDRVTDLAGASWKDDADGILSGITKGTNITYTYDCDGKGGHNATFTLVPDESSTFAPETPEITYPVPIDEEHFPDEKFRQYVSENFDTDGDGELSQEEYYAVTEIKVSGTGTSSSSDGGITSLKGIENFTKLKTLNCYLNSELRALDVSKNVALTTLNCSSTQITELDVSKNIALTYLRCEDTQITELDVSKNTKLEDLRCPRTQITSLDVSKNTALKTLHCYDTQINSLDASNNTALESLNCGNTTITSLDVSKNTELRSLLCYNTQITSLDVGNNTALKYLDCYDTQITAIDVSHNTALTRLECYNTLITSLDVSNNTALTYLSCNNTQITSLDISQNTELTQMFCQNCRLTFIDTTNNTNFSTIPFISGNKYPIPVNATEFDTAAVAGFDMSRVFSVENAEISGTKFINITGDVSYGYNCNIDGTHFATFTLVRTGEATVSLDDENEPEDDTPAVLPPDDTDTTPPPSSPDAETGADEILPEDAALPPKDIEGLRFLPLGILALMRDRKRKTAFRIKRKAEI